MVIFGDFICKIKFFLTKLRRSESSTKEFSRLRRVKSEATSFKVKPCNELI